MRNFWTDCVLATVLVFLVMWGILGITKLNIFNAFDSIGQALSDIELTDYVFSKLRKDPDVDQNIVVVNIGDLTRGEIAEEIKIISQHKPKVIGIDTFFGCPTALRDTVNCPKLRDVMGNLLLSNAIQEAGNVVLVTKVLQADTLLSPDQYDSLRNSDPIFSDFALREGYANLDTDADFQDDAKTCRVFNPKIEVDGKANYAFAVEMAMEYDSVKTKRFLERNNYEEVINYRGNVFDIYGSTGYPNVFYTLDVDDVRTGNFMPDMLKDRIVIFGFLGSFLGDPSWDDKFYTSLNNKPAGRANPDMFGAVVHANIVSMILTEDYVNQMADWQEVAMAIILCLLNVALFSFINSHLPLWYDGITKLLQLIQLILYTVLMVMIFHWFSFKLNVTLTLAAVALVGDVYEIYMSVIKNIYLKIKGWFSITPKNNPVLTPVETEES